MTTVTIPTVHTDRLVLRAPTLDDMPPYMAFRSSQRSVGVGGPFPASETFTHMAALVGHWHLRGYGRWLVADRETGTALGIVGLFYPDGWPEPEIAWSLFDGAEGRGVAYEAAMATRTYAYDTLGWKTVISCVKPDNLRSIALAKRMGAVPAGTYMHDSLGPLHLWRHLSAQEVL